jgi:dipeptidyl aminopeptidase/acylaminoacyl peptidase
MRQQNAKWMLLAPAMAAVVMFLTQPLRAEVVETTTIVHYKIVLPDGYDPAKAYPAILAFGGGPQDMSRVDNILNTRQAAMRPLPHTGMVDVASS